MYVKRPPQGGGPSMRIGFASQAGKATVYYQIKGFAINRKGVLALVTSKGEIIKQYPYQWAGAPITIARDVEDNFDTD